MQWDFGLAYVEAASHRIPSGSPRYHCTRAASVSSPQALDILQKRRVTLSAKKQDFETNKPGERLPFNERDFRQADDVCTRARVEVRVPTEF